MMSPLVTADSARILLRPAARAAGEGRFSALDHHQRERSGQDCSSASVAGGARRWRSELRGHDEYAVIGGIEPHVPRPLGCLQVLGDVILIRTVLMNHGKRAVRVRRKRIAGRGIEPGPVYAGADG